MLIEDSIAYGFKRYPHVWEKHYGNLAVNCGIAGDKVENTLWRVEKLALPCGIAYAVIICGTNNNDYNTASSIVNGLLFVALKLVSKSVEQVKISDILPREIVSSIRRNNKWITKNRMLQINIQSLLHGTISRLGNQWKPVKHEVFLQESPSSNWGRIRETLQNHKHLINVCMPIHTGGCETILLLSVETFCYLWSSYWATLSRAPFVRGRPAREDYQ